MARTTVGKLISIKNTESLPTTMVDRFFIVKEILERGITMNVKLNGKEIEIDTDFTLYQLASERVKNLDVIVIEYNGKILEKDVWNETVLKENDKIEIIRFVGGG